MEIVINRKNLLKTWHLDSLLSGWWGQHIWIHDTKKNPTTSEKSDWEDGRAEQRLHAAVAETVTLDWGWPAMLGEVRQWPLLVTPQPARLAAQLESCNLQWEIICPQSANSMNLTSDSLKHEQVGNIFNLKFFHLLSSYSWVLWIWWKINCVKYVMNLQLAFTSEPSPARAANPSLVELATTSQW